MKKIIAILSVMTLVFSFAACGKNPGEASAEAVTESVTDRNITEENKAEASDEKETAAMNTDKSEILESTAESGETTAESVTEADEMSKEEIVALYNESANKIKPTAKLITRNYNRMKNIPGELELPSAISGLGKWAIETFVKGSEDAAILDEKEEVMEYFPVQNEEYTSHLTPDMVKSATIEETDKTYEITIVLYDDKITSPAKGQGYAGVFNTVSAATFEDISIPGTTFEKVDVNGFDGKIICTMNKETKQITHITFFNSDLLNLQVKVAGKHLKVKMAFSNESDFTIQY